MANRNAKLIERVLKDFSLNIGSGGTEVVNELPDVGQEHTVYELKKKVPGQFNWFFEMFDCDYNYKNLVPFPPFVALDEDMKNELLAQDGYMIIYQKDTDKLIMKRKSSKIFDSIDKGTFVINDTTTLYILKSFEGIDEKTGDYKATTIGGKTVYLYEHEAGDEMSPDDNHYGLLLTQANELALLGQPPVIMPYMNNDMTGNNVEVQFLDTTSQLPTAKDVVEKGMMPERWEFGIEFVFIDYCAWVKETELIYNSIKLETDKKDPVNYHWNMMERKFYTPDPSGGEANVVYEGPLVWEEHETVPEVTSLTVEELVQASYNREQLCVNLNASETTVSEYYVYTNNEWVNIDDIPTPSTSLGVTYSNIRENLNIGVNKAVDIYYDIEKLVINDYYMFIPETEEPSPDAAYATVSGLPPLSNETHSFVLTICPKILVNTETDRLTISINGNEVYQSQWRETIPSEIEVIVEGISQIHIGVTQLPL